MLIAIEPTFCEGHFIEAHIRNVCEYIKPSVYIIGEGMFPQGPENSVIGNHLEKFKTKYTLDGARGFDYGKVVEAVHKCTKDYSDTEIILVPMEYPKDQTTMDSYYQVFTEFLPQLDIQPEDVIMPMETDVFFTKDQAVNALELIDDLKPGHGIGTNMRNFFENPKYSASIGFKRKLAFRYGDGTLYKKVMKLFFWESDYHPLLDEVRSLKLFHYEWIRPEGKYFDLRIDQIFTPANISQTFYEYILNALEVFKNPPDTIEEISRAINRVHVEGVVPWRPFCVQSVELKEHPKHIRNHPNFVRYYGNGAVSR